MVLKNSMKTKMQEKTTATLLGRNMGWPNRGTLCSRALVRGDRAVR